MARSTPLPQGESSEPDGSSAGTESWPWQCLGCDSAVYDDRDYCADCASTPGSVPGRPRSLDPDGFIGWMRYERYPVFLAKVSAISGVEVVLTALWLRTLLVPADLGGALVFV